MRPKGLKKAFLAKNSCFLVDFFLSGIGGYPPPLNGKSLCSKKLSRKGGVPPLNGQNPLSSFWKVPLLSLVNKYPNTPYSVERSKLMFFSSNVVFLRALTTSIAKFWNPLFYHEFVRICKSNGKTHLYPNNLYHQYIWILATTRKRWW